MMYVTVGGRWPRRFRVMRRLTVQTYPKGQRRLGFEYDEVSRHFTHRAAHRKMMKIRRGTA